MTNFNTVELELEIFSSGRNKVLLALIRLTQFREGGRCQRVSAPCDVLSLLLFGVSFLG